MEPTRFSSDEAKRELDANLEALLAELAEEENEKDIDEALEREMTALGDDADAGEFGEISPEVLAIHEEVEAERRAEEELKELEDSVLMDPDEEKEPEV
ncbi:MAG: hypothetical protein IJR36_03375, partial [Lachnospiraceae bacterium]|nr:hypothetical protein [Lachnospiraceae bacterium]